MLMSPHLFMTKKKHAEFVFKKRVKNERKKRRGDKEKRKKIYTKHEYQTKGIKRNQSKQSQEHSE